MEKPDIFIPENVKKNLDFIFHADNNFVQIVTTYCLKFTIVIKIRRDEKMEPRGPELVLVPCLNLKKHLNNVLL